MKYLQYHSIRYINSWHYLIHFFDKVRRFINITLFDSYHKVLGFMGATLE